MPNNYILKDFDGGAQKTTLTAGMNNSATSFSVTDGSTFPAGSNPFVVVVDRGLATEEKILISSRVGNSFNVLERAYDGSSAQSHSLGAVVEHILDAYTIEQANRYVNLQTAKGDLVVHDGTTTQKIGTGSNSTVLVADSAQSTGVKWAQIEAASISSGAIAAIADQVESLITPSGIPAGVITQYAGPSAPTGWLLCEGQSLSTTTYAAIFEAFGGAAGGGYRYGGAGSSFNLPNLKGRIPVGKDSTQGEFDNLGETGGAKTHTLLLAEMPSHTHTGTTASSGLHQHFYSDHPLSGNKIYGSGSTYENRAAEIDATSNDGTHTHTFTTAAAGTGTAHNNLQPYIVVNYIIKT